MPRGLGTRRALLLALSLVNPLLAEDHLKYGQPACAGPVLDKTYFVVCYDPARKLPAWVGGRRGALRRMPCRSRALSSMPADTARVSWKFFVCLESTGLNTPETMFPMVLDGGPTI
jgi:hypothetical protein